MQMRAAVADQSVSFGAWTTATGAAVTVTAATAGLSLWYRRGVAGAKTAISVSDLATLITAHTDGGILVIEGQEHRLDLPDAATLAGVTSIEWGGTATGITIDGGRADLIGQANTTTDISHALGRAVGDVGVGNTAHLLQSADSGATAVARTGADADTLETLSDQLDGVAAQTDKLSDTTEVTP